VLVDGAMTGNSLMMQTLADFLSEFSSPTNAGPKFDASINLAITVQGESGGRGPGLGWSFHSLPGSACANGNLAELARQLD